MTRTELLGIIDEISNLQRRMSFILTGFYLGTEDLHWIESELAPDEPSVGALGRFRGVPVFVWSGVRPEGKNFACHQGVYYSFVEMDAVD